MMTFHITELNAKFGLSTFSEKYVILANLYEIYNFYDTLTPGCANPFSLYVDITHRPFCIHHKSVPLASCTSNEHGRQLFCKVNGRCCWCWYTCIFHMLSDNRIEL